MRTAAAARVAALARPAAPAAGGNRHRSHLPQVGAACLPLPLRMQCLNWPEDCSCSCGSAPCLLLFPPTTTINPRRHWPCYLPGPVPPPQSLAC